MLVSYHAEVVTFEFSAISNYYNFLHLFMLKKLAR